jgi:hypothetical protein
MKPTSESSTSDKSQASLDEALRTLRSGLLRIDAERAIAYGQLATFLSAKRNLLARQEKLLALKLGESNPRVLALQTQRAAMEGKIRDLQAAQAQTAISVPDVGPSGYAVYGFVRSALRAPLANATAAVYDENRRIRRDFKPATTDENGYFQLVSARLISAAETPGKLEEQSPSVSLELRIFDARRKPLAHDTPPIEALPGQSEFREVRVVVNAAANPPPPEVVPAEQPPPKRSPDNSSSILQAMTEGLRAGERSPQVSGTTAPESASKKTRRRKSQQRQRKQRP